jgi:hypothetical protein
MAEFVVCDHAREDCAGCTHYEPHNPIHEQSGTCEEEKRCAFHDINVKCVEYIP